MRQRLCLSLVTGMLATLLALSLPSLAQTSSHHHHINIAHPALIDGSVHPEQIPDVSAYRLWFLTVSLPPNGTTESQRSIQNAQIAVLHLSHADRFALLTALASFNVHYTALVTDNNAAVASAAKSFKSLDNAAFLRVRDALVNGVMDDLRAQLSPEGFSNLHAYIQGEKRNMRLSPVNK